MLNMKQRPKITWIRDQQLAQSSPEENFKCAGKTGKE
jgi:hypothetical protein